jgi:hypothetical protein
MRNVVYSQQMKQPFPANFHTLKEALVDWVDADVAMYYLACCIGLMGPEGGSLDKFRDAKDIFWSANEIGETLWRFLDSLVACGVLEKRELEYRWNSGFKGAWEG